jgi:putative phage-type endonuclease
MIFHDIEQNTEEWFQLRRGRITASVIKAIMAAKGLGEGAKTLAKKLAMEIVVKDYEARHFSSEWMDHGHEFEDVARAAFEDATGLKVENGGFFALGDYAGVSPDGRILNLKPYKLVLTEIKCPDYQNHLDCLESGEMDKQYTHQVQFQMAVTGAEACYFISYLDTDEDWISSFPSEQQLFYTLVEADKDHQALIMTRIDEFKKMIDKYVNVIKGV